ncbi:hypothetical protein D3C83_334180 [compost metagenome]
MLGEQEKPDVHRWQRRVLEPLRQVEKIRARGPGEVVYVVLLIAMGRRAVRVVRSRRLAA